MPELEDQDHRPIDPAELTEAHRIAGRSGIAHARAVLAGVAPAEPPRRTPPPWSAEALSGQREPSRAPADDPVGALKAAFPGAMLIDEYGRPLPGEATAAKQAIARAGKTGSTPLPHPDLFDHGVAPGGRDRHKQEAS